MVENYNDVEPVSEAIVEPIVYKSCNFKLLIVSIIVTPVIYLTPWEVVKAGLFFLLLFLHNIVVFQDLIKCLPVKGKKGHVSTGLGWSLNPISFIYYYTYSKEKITLDKIIVQILRCIILACIFIIVCILFRFAMLNPPSQWDEFSIHKPYNYLQWLPILLISYFIFVLVDFLFLQRLYGLYITIRKVSKEHIQQVDGELYYINPEEKEISQEEDIVEISIEEQNRKANKKIYLCQ